MKDGILHVEVWAEQSTEEQSSTAAAIKRRNQFSFTAPVRLQRRRALAHFRCQASEAVCCARQDMGAVRRAYTEANMEAEIQGQKLTEVITKLKGDLKTVAERNARLLRKMTEMQLLMTDASRKGLVSPQVRRMKPPPLRSVEPRAAYEARALLVQVLKEALELLKPGGKSKFIQAAKLIGDAHASVAGGAGDATRDGSVACAIM